MRTIKQDVGVCRVNTQAQIINGDMITTIYLSIEAERLRAEAYPIDHVSAVLIQYHVVRGYFFYRLSFLSTVHHKLYKYI